MKITIPNFANKTELFKFLHENKKILIDEKKFEMKTGDGISYRVSSYEGKGEATKAIENPAQFTGDKISVDVVINTTNIMDSHS